MNVSQCIADLEARVAALEQRLCFAHEPRLLTHNGKTLPMSTWAKLRGMSVQCLTSRINAGWDVAAAIDTPVRKQRKIWQQAKD